MRWKRNDTNRAGAESYNFPDPTTCFYFAALDFTFAVLLLFTSVGAGLFMSLIAALFATVGLLKQRRIIK